MKCNSQIQRAGERACLDTALMPDSNEDISTTQATGKPHSKRGHKEQPLRVILPDELPVLTPAVSRILLDILIELTDGTDWRKHLRPEKSGEPDAEVTTN